MQAFDFDRVFGPEVQQAGIFQDVSQLVTSALDGYNVCIFAYGQTGKIAFPVHMDAYLCMALLPIKEGSQCITMPYISCLPDRHTHMWCCKHVSLLTMSMHVHNVKFCYHMPCNTVSAPQLFLR